jgi:hypothetical protein
MRRRRNSACLCEVLLSPVILGKPCKNATLSELGGGIKIRRASALGGSTPPSGTIFLILVFSQGPLTRPSP